MREEFFVCPRSHGEEEMDPTSLTLQGQQYSHSGQQAHDTLPPKAFHVGEVVSFFPVDRRYGPLTNTLGTIASQVYPDPVDHQPVCLVTLRDDPLTVVFAVSDLQSMTEVAAIEELTNHWGYRDITNLIRKLNEQEHAEPESYDYLCVLQRPDGEPFYIPKSQHLFQELDEVRAAGIHYEHCPAPDPEKNLWMVVGNFVDFCGNDYQAEDPNEEDLVREDRELPCK